MPQVSYFTHIWVLWRLNNIFFLVRYFHHFLISLIKSMNRWIAVGNEGRSGLERIWCLTVFSILYPMKWAIFKVICDFWCMDGQLLGEWGRKSSNFSSKCDVLLSKFFVGEVNNAGMGCSFQRRDQYIVSTCPGFFMAFAQLSSFLSKVECLFQAVINYVSMIVQ